MNNVPSDARIVGLVVGHKYRGVVDKLVESITNEEVNSIVRFWDQHSKEREFLIVCFEPRKDGVYIAALGTTWSDAKDAVRHQLGRLNEFAGAKNFSSYWILFIDGDQSDEVQRIIADAQVVSGVMH